MFVNPTPKHQPMFFEDEHRYVLKTGKKNIPSSTTIVKNLKVKTGKHKYVGLGYDMFNDPMPALKGSARHKYAELRFIGHSSDELNIPGYDDVKEEAEKMISRIIKYRSKLFAVELISYNLKPFYAGTIDLILKFDDFYRIIDWKTTYSKTQAMQLSSYKQLFSYNFDIPEDYISINVVSMDGNITPLDHLYEESIFKFNKLCDAYNILLKGQ